MSGTAAARSPGRPRSAEADAAIVRATLELLIEQGFRGLSVEAVRERAGVGKATIYRRFPDKSALVRATLEHLHAQLEIPDTGNVRDDLRRAWEVAYGASPTAAIRMLMPRLLVDAVDDPELFEVFRATLVEPRREAMRMLLERGVERGQLRADLDLDLVVDLVAGPMVYRVLIEGGAIDDPVGRAVSVFDTLLAGIGPEATPPPPSRGRPRG